MNKQEFLQRLRSGLIGLPQEDIEDRVSFYDELIDDKMEEGVSEEEAVRQIGPVDDVISQIISDTPLTKLVREKVKPKRSLQAWEIVLLILGAPIWLSLLIALITVILSVYIVLWSVIITLWTVMAVLAVSAVMCIVGTVVIAASGNGMTAIMALGTGMLCAGLAIFMFFGSLAATKGVIWLTKKFALWIKSLFVGKEGQHEQNS